MEYERHESCGVILFRTVGSDRLFLTLRYTRGHFEFPKGHIEKTDKDLHDTALRELREETGITKVEIIPGFHEKIRYKFHDENKVIDKSVDFFLASTIEENVVISDEHTDYKWLVYEDAVKQVTFKNSKELLFRANEFLNQASK